MACVTRQGLQAWWLLVRDDISRQADETLGGLDEETNPRDTARDLKGGLVWSSHVMPVRNPIPIVREL